MVTISWWKIVLLLIALDLIIDFTVIRFVPILRLRLRSLLGMGVFVLTETESGNPSHCFTESFSSFAKAQARMMDLYGGFSENPVARCECGSDSAYVEFADGNSVHYRISRERVQ